MESPAPVSEPVFVPTKPDTVYAKPDTVYKTKLVPINMSLVADTASIYEKVGADTALLTIAYAEGVLPQDSSVFHVKYYFPPINRFEINAFIKQKEVTVYQDRIINRYIPTEENHGILENFHIGPQVGIGYGVVSGKPDIFFGVGLSYEF